MKSYRSFDSMKIPGRGLVFMVTLLADQIRPELEEVVIIDNNKYTVIGVEGSRHLTSPPTDSPNIGILVREEVK